MTMLAMKTDPGIEYNSEFFDEASIAKLLALKVPEGLVPSEEPRLLRDFDLPAFVSQDAASLYNDAETKKALTEALSFLMEDPEVKKEIEQGDKETLYNDAAKSLKDQLTTAALDETVSENNRLARDSIELHRQADGKLVVEVNDTPILSVDTKALRGLNFELILQIAFVVLDFFALLCTVIGIAIEHTSGWAKRIAEYLKGIGQSMLDWATKMLGKAGNLLSRLGSAHGGGSSKYAQAVKSAAKEVASWVVEAAKLGYNNRHFLNSIKYCYKCLFKGPWYKKAYYGLQLVASIILMIGTAGSSLILKVVLAVVQLGILVWDSFVLGEMLHPKKMEAAMA